MRLENIIIIALVAALVYFGFIKKSAKPFNVSQNANLPTPSQESQGDGGAATALISQGIGAASGVLNNLIDHAFQRSADSTPPITQSATI